MARPIPDAAPVTRAFFPRMIFIPADKVAQTSKLLQSLDLSALAPCGVAL